MGCAYQWDGRCPQGIKEKVLMEIMFHVPDRATRDCKRSASRKRLFCVIRVRI